MTANKKKALVTIVGVAAVLTLVIGGTLAYLQDKTDIVTNEFQKNKVEISLTETGNGQFSIVPGTSVTKDPKVSGTATLPSYVFLEVEDKSQNLVTYNLADDWLPLTGYEGLYYREVAGSAENGTFSFDVLKDNQVTYNSSITNETMKYDESTPATLAFTSTVIQKEPFNTPENAWNQWPATKISTGENLKSALEDTNAGKNVALLLTEDVTLPYPARKQFCGSETETIVIDGGGHKLHLQGTDTDWSSIGTANENAKFIFRNVTIDKTEPGNGAWNNHAINFSCDVEMADVTVYNLIAVKEGHKIDLTNVKIVENQAQYSLWLKPGCTANLNNVTITATNGGRAVKIGDEYVNTTAAAQPVNLSIADSKFASAKKAAILVSSVGGANITLSNLDITDVAADKVNAVWVDKGSKWSGILDAGKVKVTGGSVILEPKE